MRSPWHGSVFPVAKFKDAARVTLSWGEGLDGNCTWSPLATRELQLSKSWPRLPCGVVPMQITQAEHVALIKPGKHGTEYPMRLLQND